MPQKRYIVRLTAQEREVCQQTLRKLNGSSEKVRRAQVLLKADADGPAWTDERIADAFSCRTKTVENIRQRCVLQGFEQALERKRREFPPVPKLLNGEQEAHIIALRLGPPPKGYANWSLRLLARSARVRRRLRQRRGDPVAPRNHGRKSPGPAVLRGRRRAAESNLGKVAADRSRCNAAANLEPPNSLRDSLVGDTEFHRDGVGGVPAVTKRDRLRSGTLVNRGRAALPQLLGETEAGHSSNCFVSGRRKLMVACSGNSAAVPHYGTRRAASSTLVQGTDPPTHLAGSIGWQ